MALGMLVKGKWITERNDQDQNGKFHEKSTTFTTGNTNAPTIMIGEKAADLIKAVA